jgi:putative nucleotidyltransferase with HDIG domain
LALKILIADPDESWTEESRAYFSDQLYEVTTAFTGKDCQLKLYQEKYFALILNWSIRNHSAKQVLAFARKNYPQLMVVVLVEDISLLETNDDTVDSLIKQGANAVLLKPYDRQQINEALESGGQGGNLRVDRPLREGVSAEVEVDGEDSKFSAIKINEFFSGKAVLFDVFIRLRANRYVKILHAGDTFSSERIKKYRDEKGVEYLYFNNSDRKKFIQFNNLVAQKLISNEKVASQTKISLVKNITSQYIEEINVEGIKPQVVEQGKEICATVYDLVEKDKQLYKFLKDFQSLDPSAYSHSFLVTLYATSIIKQFDWQSSQTLQSVAMACMFHDIGKLSLPKELILKRPADMNEDELTLYKTHPTLGAEMVQSNKFINNVVKQVILQHHEAHDGMGYPNGIKGSRILLVANIVALVDDFVHLMIDQGTSPVETLRLILQDKDMIKRYHSSIMENFIKVFVDPEKLAKDKPASKKAS